MTTGTIQNIESKSGSSWFKYSMNINGEWYGMFTNAGKFDHVQVGDEVEFEYTVKGKYKNIDDGSFKVIKKASAEQVQAATKSNNQTQERIFYSGVQKPAVELVGYMLQHELVPVPGKKADRYEAVLDLVREVTGELADQVTAYASGQQQQQRATAQDADDVEE